MSGAPLNRREISPAKLALLDAMLREQGVNGNSYSAPSKRARGDSSPLSFAQQRLWFLDQLAPGSSLYNIDLALPLNFAVEIDALRDALNEIVRRHESLRTTFHCIAGEPIQRVSPPIAAPLTVEDLSGLTAEARVSGAQRITEEEASRPYDLARGPLFRARLLRLGPEEHVLLIGMHHIVADGWSLDVFSRELTAIYDAYVLHQPSPLPDLPLQYSDFAIWQLEWLSGPVLDKHLRYWRAKLAGLPALQTPVDYHRPPVSSFRGASQSFFIAKETCDALRALSHATRATLFIAVLAAYKVLLLRYTGQEDIVVGSPVANRNRSEIEALIGFFVNTLVLRTDLSGDPTFLEALSRVRETALDAYTHQDMPFEKLVEDLHPERDVNHTPLFQVMFALENELAGGDLQPPDEDQWDIREGTAKFDLTLSLIGWAGGLRGVAEYSTDLFATETIRAFLEHFRTLLKSIAADPHARLSQLPLLTNHERHTIVDDWNCTRSTYDRGRSVERLVEEVASARPQDLAVASAEQLLTYRELSDRSDLLARQLREWGVGPKCIVPVLVERSAHWVVALLSVLKSGAAYLPIDPSSPPQRVAFLLADSRCSVVLSEECQLPLLPEGGSLKVFCLDSDWHLLRTGADRDALPSASAEDLAYIIYTSGSTGEPKGVEISRGSLANLVHWHRNAYSVTPGDRASQIANAAFDASVWEIWPYLCSGASVHIVDAGTRDDASAVMEWMVEHGITIAFLPTPLAAVVLEQPLPTGLRLRAILTGGDRLHRAPKQPLQFRLFNHYGPTETTVVATAAEVDPNCDEQPPIGRPISNVRTYVLDRNAALVPPGAVGELYIGGDGVARGYLNRPELTNVRFVDNPFHPGEKLYRTGDLVRQRLDGALHFVGRTDSQVKIRGYRIELGEIEGVLRRHELIRETAVVAREVSPGNMRLIAYVAPLLKGSLKGADISSFLSAKLPAYMVPSVIIFIDELPLTPNGKLDAAALPDPTQNFQVATASFALPRTEMERKIADVWVEVLGLSQIDVNDNFFDLGGHSLLMIRLQSKLGGALKRQISIVDLFRYPTVHTFAEYLTADDTEGPGFDEAHLRAQRQREALNQQSRKRIAKANSHG